MKQLLLSVLAALALAALPGCMSHAVRVEPIAVAPMHVTMDVNLHVEDERAASGSETSAETADESAAETADEAADEAENAIEDAARQ